MKRIYFYSSVKDIGLFETQKFYKIDIDILTDLGYEVSVTNKITDFFNFKQYNIAYIYFYRYGLFVAIIARLLGKKVFFTGGIDYLDQTYASKKDLFIQRVFFKLCLMFSTNCILVSTADLHNVMRIYKGRLSEKIKLSFHAFNVEKYKCEDYEDKGYDFITIAWMGTVQNVIRKGLDKAIELFAALRQKYPEYRQSRFFIVGKQGEGSEFLKEKVKIHNVGEWVVFTGEMNEDEKVSLLKKSRFYFQLSYYEGFGVAAAEALAAGNIVLNSGRGGLKDSVGEHGVYVDIDSDMNKQIDNIHLEIKKNNVEKLMVGSQYIADCFSYEIRKREMLTIVR